MLEGESSPSEFLSLKKNNNNSFMLIMLGGGRGCRQEMPHPFFPKNPLSFLPLVLARPDSARTARLVLAALRPLRGMRAAATELHFHLHGSFRPSLATGTLHGGGARGLRGLAGVAAALEINLTVRASRVGLFRLARSSGSIPINDLSLIYNYL